ncbi:MAG TPA: hypothetical protein VGD59_11985 [Acidisarcina sp.]
MFQNQYEVSGNLNWLLGKHNLAIGYSGDYTQLNIINRATDVATLTFNTFTDFVEGNVKPGLGNSQVFQGSANRYYRAPQTGVYANDKFNVTSTLAVTAGLRWDYDGAISEKYGHLVNFDARRYNYDPTSDTIVNDGLLVAGNDKQFHTSGTSSSTLNGRQWGLAPRVGLIYSLKENLVMRAGFGLYFDRGEFFSYFSPGAGNGYNGPFGVTLQPPFVLPTASVAGATLSQPFTAVAPVTGDPATFAALLPNAGQLASGDYPAGNQFGSYLFAGYDIHNKLPYSENWNLDVQWQPRNNWTADVAYTGNHGLHLITPVPFNQPGIATPSHPIHGQTSSYGYGSYTTNLAEEPINTATGGNTELRVPFIGYSPNSVLYEATAISHYDALQTSLNHQASNGLQFTVSYTYSHSLDEQSGLGLFYNGNDPTNLASGYGNSDFDRTHVLVVDYYYELPKLGGKSLLSKFTDGWAWAGIATLQSGQPFSVYDYSGSVASLYYGTSDYITNPLVPFAPGRNAKNAKTGHSGLGKGKPAIDPTAFVVPVLTAGTTSANAYGVPAPAEDGADNIETTFGPSGNRNVFRSAFQKRADMSLVKITNLTERYQMRYSFDAFNITNTPSLDAPNNDVNFNPHYDGNYVAVPHGNLGVVQHTVGSPRFVSMSLRLTF